MNLDDPEDRDVAAGEYVVGTLAAHERAGFEARLEHDAALQAAVYQWQDRLLDLTRRTTPVAPDADAWTRIAARIVAPVRTNDATRVDTNEAANEAANDSFWNRLGTWRAAAGLAMAASLVLAVQLAMRGPMTPARENDRYLAVLQSPVEKSTGWLVEATANEGVRLVPVGDPVPPPPGRALQFWTKPNGAKGPTSLGLVKPGEVAVVPLAQLPSLGEKQLFEVTLEPEGGSTIGKPTGPVLYVGSTVHL